MQLVGARAVCGTSTIRRNATHLLEHADRRAEWYARSKLDAALEKVKNGAHRTSPANRLPPRD